MKGGKEGQRGLTYLISLRNLHENVFIRAGVDVGMVLQSELSKGALHVALFSSALNAEDVEGVVQRHDPVDGTEAIDEGKMKIKLFPIGEERGGLPAVSATDASVGLPRQGRPYWSIFVRDARSWRRLETKIK